MSHDETGSAPPAEALQPPAADGEEASTQALADLIAAIDGELAQATGWEETRPPSPARTLSPGQRLIVFSLAGSKYAAPVANVVEVGKPLPTTPVPNVPAWVLGLANLRGEVLSVVDLASYLGLPPSAAPGRLMVVRTGAEPLTSGLVVGEVTGMLAVAGAHLTSPTAPVDERISPYLAGVYDTGQGVVSVLDFDRLLAAPAFRQFEPA
jgi:chemotaxis signal transduction protein